MTQIVISLDPATKQLGVQGAIGDKVMALGMLALAAKIIQDMPAKAPEPGIVMANQIPRINGGR